MQNSFSIISLGCPKNLVDSDNLVRRLAENGLPFVANPEDAAIILINTCGFIEDAKKESIEEILKLVKIKKGSCKKITSSLEPSNPRTLEPFPKLIVFGCLAKRYRDELIKEIPDIDAIFGVGEDEKIVEYCKKIQGSRGQGAKGPGEKIISCLEPSQSYAYLKIAEGCNKKCSYCVIPSIRGKYRSAKPDEILKEAELRIKRGARELILVAQDTACYGKDLRGYDLSRLLKDLCSISGNFWIRPLYTYPASISDSLLNVISGQKKICKYLDIPFQHSEDRILNLMKRAGTREGYLSLIKKIRAAIPDITLRTTFIAGFPTEKEEEFNSLIDFIDEAQFDRLGAFKYSKEEGTPAAKLRGQIPEAIKKKRVESIMRHQSKISLEKNKALIGKEFSAIIDEISHGVALARLNSHAPEIDGLVIIEKWPRGQGVKGSRLRQVAGETKGQASLSLEPSNPQTLEPCSVKAGDFIIVKIIDAYDYDLKGIIVR